MLRANGVSQGNNAAPCAGKKDRIEICAAHTYIGSGEAQCGDHLLGLQTLSGNLPVICIKEFVCLTVQTPDRCDDRMVKMSGHKCVSGILAIEKIAGRLE